MRRLPVYFLIDVSESMIGEPILNVEEGLATIINQLKKDPFALETVFVAIIVFAGKSQNLVPLIEISQFYPPKLPIGGGTSLGEAFDFLMKEIDENIVKTTFNQKGDWKPIVFLLTDGKPTDDYEKALTTWNQKYKSKINLIAVSFGTNANLNILGRFTENVLLFNSSTQEDYKKFFKWVTASIRNSSQSISEANNDSVKLAPITNGFLSKIDISKKYNTVVDDNYAIFLARCQTTGKPYLMKYQKNIRKSELSEFVKDIYNYKLIGTFAIEHSYFELSEEIGSENKINSEELIGFPICPWCGNNYGFSICGCGKILCTGDMGNSKCPWCENISTFSAGTFSVNIKRTIG